MASIIRYKDKWRALIRTSKTSKSRVFATKREAQIWARSEEVEAETNPGKAANATTFSDVVKVYNEHSRRQGASKTCSIEMLDREIGTKRLSELVPQTFIDLAHRRAEKVAPSTIGQELTYVGTILRYGGILIGAGEVTSVALAALAAARMALRHMDVIAPTRERSRRPTDAELEKLKTRMTGSTRSKTPMWDIVCFAVSTSMRLGEIASIRKEDVDFKARTVVVRNRKHPTQKVGNDMVVPLLVGPTTICGELIDPIEIIKAQPVGETGRIFPYSPETTTIKFARVTKVCKIFDLHFHDLRHDGISRLFEAGYSIEQVALVSGHRDWKQLKRYTNINPVTLHR